MRTTTRALVRHYIDELDLRGDVLDGFAAMKEQLQAHDRDLRRLTAVVQRPSFPRRVYGRARQAVTRRLPQVAR